MAVHACLKNEFTEMKSTKISWDGSILGVPINRILMIVCLFFHHVWNFLVQVASLEERLDRLEAALGNTSQDKLVMKWENILFIWRCDFWECSNAVHEKW